MAAKAKKSNSERKLARLRAQLIVALTGIEDSLHVLRLDAATLQVVALGDPLLDFDRARLRLPEGTGSYPFKTSDRLQWGYVRESVERLVGARRERGRAGLMMAQRALNEDLQAALRWAAALRQLNVPATAELGIVNVEDVGRVPVPGEELSRAAEDFVMDATESSLDRIIGRARRELGAEIWLDATAHSVRIRLGSSEIGRITRYTVKIGREALVRGDVLAKHADWARVRRAVTRRYAKPRGAKHTTRRSRQPASPKPAPASTSKVGPQPERRVESSPPPQGRVASEPGSNLRLEFPPSLPESARRSAMSASRRLRTDRSLVPAIPIEVRTPAGSVTFEPLKEGQNPLELRFSFERGGERLDAGLRLRRPDDPMSLRVERAADEQFVGIAWATALIIYAELTCQDLAELQIPSGVSAPIRRSPVASRSRLGPLRHQTGGARRDAQFATFRELIVELHSVSGHLRRLRVGGRASDEQRRLAEHVGVRIPDGFTWVRPHSRGGERRVVAWPSGLPLW